MLRRTRTGARVAGLAAVAALALIAAGCGSSSSTTTTTATTATAAASAPVASTTTTEAAPESGLSGQWNGKYGGAYSGTFVLHWQQSGSSLSGRITLSTPGTTVDVNGTLHGDSITFGTVGSTAITYTGTVTGSSMSGSYQTPGGGGSWSASKG